MRACVLARVCACVYVYVSIEPFLRSVSDVGLYFTLEHYFACVCVYVCVCVCVCVCV